MHNRRGTCNVSRRWLGGVSVACQRMGGRVPVLLILCCGVVGVVVVVLQLLYATGFVDSSGIVVMLLVIV